VNTDDMRKSKSLLNTVNTEKQHDGSHAVDGAKTPSSTASSIFDSDDERQRDRHGSDLFHQSTDENDDSSGLENDSSSDDDDDVNKRVSAYNESLIHTSFGGGLNKMDAGSKSTGYGEHNSVANNLTPGRLLHKRTKSRRAD